MNDSVSSSMPRNVRHVVGPSHFLVANGRQHISINICRLRSHSVELGGPVVMRLSKRCSKAWFTICRKGLATHALTLAATTPIAGIDLNSIPAFRRVAFKRQIEKFCVDSINSSLAKFNATPLRHIVNQA